MKVKVLKTFKDKYTGNIYKADEVIEITKTRFDEILAVDVLVEELAEETEDLVQETEDLVQETEDLVQNEKKTAKKATRKKSK